MQNRHIRGHIRRWRDSAIGQESFSRAFSFPTQGVGTEDDSVRTLSEAAALGKAAQVTLTNYRRNGDAFVNYLSITPVHNNKGQLTHYVGVQSDITELVKHKKAELAAKHQAVQVVDSLTAKAVG